MVDMNEKELERYSHARLLQELYCIRIEGTAVQIGYAIDIRIKALEKELGVLTNG